MSLDKKKSPDSYDLESGVDGSSACRDAAEQRNEEPSSCVPGPSGAEPFASSSTLKDDQKSAAKEYASSGGMTTTAATITTHSTSSTPPSPGSGQAASKRRKQQEQEYRFSFREPFLEKLRLMLDNETNADGGSIQWLDEEDAFVILDQNKFEKDVIPKYFTPIIFQSFLRKLYRWGFKRINTTHTGHYKFASATFKRSPAPCTALKSVTFAGTTSISVDQLRQVPFSFAPNNNALEMLQGYAQLCQQSAANTQPNQLNLSMLAQLQQSMQPRDNAALANVIAQQSLHQAIQLQQQINRNQASSVLQNFLAQQLVNQGMLHGVTSSMFTPAPGHHDLIRTLGAASQAPLALFLNQNQPLLNAPALRTGPLSEQALSPLISNIQNATTASGGTNQDPAITGTTESSSPAGSDDSRRLLPQSQSDSSSIVQHSQRKRKHSPPPSR